MMKAPIRGLISLLAIALALTTLAGCDPSREPTIAAGLDACAFCGMVIDDERHACAYVVDREVQTFCSPGCLLKSFESRRKERAEPPDRVLFADYEERGLHDADSVTFLLTDRIPTVMDCGILGFTEAERARQLRHDDSELLVDWLGLRTLRGELDRSVELVLTPEGFDPAVVELVKGELVELEIEGRGLERDEVVRLRGYDELGELLIPASGAPVGARLLTTRPGAGFPFVRTEDGVVLGQLRVAGAHTPDEEEL